ncbi:MAG: hypothetical protein HY699_16790 [Deltaproteobacteria bacterium]|nr:hypothetical protein [Deltaproteobacteria bacterium]
MSNELFGDRRKALEDDFFRRQDAALIARRRTDEQRRAARAALAAASHITDDVLLDQLVALGISADTLTALSLVPLVEVAWADGKVEDAEKQAILTAAKAAGLEETSAGHKLLASCLSERPHTRLRKMWEQYIASLCTTLSAEQRDALKTELLQQARQVAEAAGGFLGLGSKQGPVIVG